MKIKTLHFIITCLLLVSCKKPAESQNKINYYKVWGEASHNAFTDLTIFKGKFYLVLREGSAHGSEDGGVRILQSADGKTFKSVLKIADPDFDLRDPKVININDSVMYVQYGMSNRSKMVVRNGMLWSKDGEKWTERNVYTQDDAWWLWGITKIDNELFSVGYRPFKNDFNKLYRSKTLGVYSPVAKIPTGSFSSGEASIVSSKDTVFCAIRATHYSLPSYVGYALKKNLSEWKSFPLNTELILGGPKLFFLPSGKLYLLTRSNRDRNLQTCLYRVDPKSFEVTYVLTVPSRGDNAYGGIAYDKKDLYISYYSTFESKSEVFVAKIPLAEIN